MNYYYDKIYEFLNVQKELHKLHQQVYYLNKRLNDLSINNSNYTSKKKNKLNSQNVVNISGEEMKEEQPQMVPIGKHTLPPLPYDYDALEPYIDEQTMRLHHDKHHQGYVDGLNKAERKLKEAREKNNYDLAQHWERELAFNGAGHYLHTIFWYNMKPQGGGTPSGEIAEAINDYFGNFKRFKNQFSAAAAQVEGSGWTALVWSPRSHHLEILQFEKHQNLSQQDIIPLLVLDVWEHAYYLKYQNKRKEYIDAWWNVVNWDNVNDRYLQAKKLQWAPY